MRRKKLFIQMHNKLDKVSKATEKSQSITRYHAHTYTFTYLSPQFRMNTHKDTNLAYALI